MYEVTIYLKSGNTMRFTCSSYEIERDRHSYDYTGYKFKDSSKSVSFNPFQIEAYCAKQV